MLTMWAVEKGSRTAPAWKNGCPKISTRSPSTYVTVPIAEKLRSPRSRSTATALPGTTVVEPPGAARPPGVTVKPLEANIRLTSSNAAGFSPPAASGSGRNEGRPGIGVRAAGAGVPASGSSVQDNSR
jgi:hypothetical protein